MNTPTPSTHYATRRGGTKMHVVVGITGWHSGMVAAVAECGQRHVDVLDLIATRETTRAIRDTTCKRCLHILGWDL